MQEKIVESKKCKQCDVKFNITDKDLEFYNKVSPVFNNEKFNIPSPTLCPDCRQQRRLAWRNETKLYKRNCSLTDKPVVSIYSPDKDFITYNQDDWWSDKYNPFDYGIDFDFSKTFFDQFRDFQKKVPRITILNGFSDNADYGNHSYHNKNSYFVNTCGYVEDCYYGVAMVNSKDSMDCYKLEDSENCYESIDSKKCFNCKYILNCNNCSDLLYCDDCEGVKDCIGCKGLVNKQYCILNKQYSKEEYIKLSKNITLNTENSSKFLLEYNSFKKTVPSRNLKILNSENISYSDKIINSNNVYKCFDCENATNIRFCSELMYLEVNNCYDYDLWGENASYIYEVHCSGDSKNILFSNVIWGGSNMIYCDNCLNNSKNCFGCIGLKNNEEYCIFNKQFTKEEYEIQVSRIIKHMISTGEWGEYFPANLSPFGYNETVIQQYVRLDKDKAIKNDFNWSDYETPLLDVEKIIPSDKLPKNIKDIPDDILNWAIECEVTKKPFRIIKQELDFYRKHNLPIPSRHPDVRHIDRLKTRNQRNFYDKKCDKCGIDMKTTCNPNQGEIVYCEECYNKEIY